MSIVLVAAWLDADEHYHARAFTPSGAFGVASSSLGLMAYAVDEQTRKLHEAATLEWVWLGLMAEPVTPGSLVAALDEARAA